MNNIEDENGNKDSRIKLIRDESIGEYSWDTSPSNINGGYGINEWSQADIMKLLNQGYESEITGGSLYYNSSSGKCYNGSNNMTVDCNFMNTSLKDNSKEYEAEYFLTSEIYNLERSNNNAKHCEYSKQCTDNILRTTKWLGNIGLLFMVMRLEETL